MKTKEEFEQKIFKALKDGEQHDYDREDNLVPVYNYAEVKENIVFLADEYAKQQAIAFAKFTDRYRVREKEIMEKATEKLKMTLPYVGASHEAIYQEFESQNK